MSQHRVHVHKSDHSSQIMRRELNMPKKPKAPDPTKTRNIYFFRIDAGADNSGESNKVDLRPLVRDVERLPFTDSGRYQTIGNDGDRICIWVDSSQYPVKIRFGSIRVSGLPQAEAEGVLSDLNLAINQGLCEASHICMFEDGIVGVENNFYGPRISRLASYLLNRSQSAGMKFELEQLIRGDAAEMLLGKDGIRSLELRVRRSYISVIEEADSTLGSAFAAAAQAGNAETVAVILRPEPYQRKNLRTELLGTLGRLVRRPDLRENANPLECHTYR